MSIFGGTGELWRLSKARTRSISPENFTGAPGAGGRAEQGTGAKPARDLGRGWKVSPSVNIGAGATFTLADIEGPGILQHFWIVATGHWRFSILRVYWDEEEQPSIEVPLGDFFACGWGQYAQISSLAVCVNPGSGFNSYWPMPFRRRCRMTLENVGTESITTYYQLTYALDEVPADAAYFHAQFRRVNPLPYKEVYTILDGVRGQGHYVGTHLCWGVNNSGWWGEGEIKFYMDGDVEFPTICGTGTEDYFCGSYNFDPGAPPGSTLPNDYREFTTPYTGMHLHRPDGVYRSQTRFGLYRWHLPDPIRFERELRVTIQALGWRSDGRYLPLQDDIASVAFWYQTLPKAPFPALPGKDELEII